MQIQALLALTSALFGGSPAPAIHAPVSGDYVEARTASVWAGGCHYSAEEPASGRDAVMAWKFSSGDWNGVNLAGVEAVAVVTSDDNLADASPARKFELVIDSSASAAQVAAVTNLIETNYSDSVGTLTDSKRGNVNFLHEGSEYKVVAKGFASVDVKSLPDPTCCYQSQDIWYEPLVSLKDAEVGYTVRSAYAGGMLGDKWMRAGENSAFYGPFEVEAPR
jgi:hypothetical protein